MLHENKDVGPTNLPIRVIERCGSKEDAVMECWNHRVDRSLTHESAAAKLGIKRVQFTKMLAGQVGFRGNQESAFQRICGNRAIAQYQAWEIDCHLVENTWAQHYARRASDYEKNLARRATDHLEAA